MSPEQAQKVLGVTAAATYPQITSIYRHQLAWLYSLRASAERTNIRRTLNAAYAALTPHVHHTEYACPTCGYAATIANVWADNAGVPQCPQCDLILLPAINAEGVE
jgi:hypothetical protein